MKKPKVMNSTLAYKGFMNLKIDELQKEDGTRGSYTIIDTNGNASVILAKDEKGLFVVNYEYRHGSEDYMLSLPGGRLEKGESPLDGAKREFLEETGYLAADLILLGAFYPLPSICNQKLFFFFVPKAKKVQEPKLDPLEIIYTKLMTEKELLEEVGREAKIDTILLSALFLFLKKDKK